MVSDHSIVWMLALLMLRLISGLNFTESDNYIRLVGENNSSILLDCSVNLDIGLVKRIDWRYKDVDMNTPKPNAVFSENRQMLTLTQYGPHDSGRYTCKVTALNKETIRRTFNLPTTLKPYVEPNEKGIKYIDAIQGSEVNFECAARQYFTKSYVWFFNGIIIDDNEHYRIKAHRLLRIKNVNVEHSGVYKCRVENDFGYTDIQYALNVSAVGNQTSEMKPRLKNNSTLYADLVMNSMVLDCSVSGAEPINVTWWKNDKQIELRSNLSNPRYTFSVDFTKLELRELRQDDTGNYKCIMENKYGKVEHVMLVEIYEKLFAKPIISSTDKHKIFYVDYGQNLTVPIYVTAFLPHPHFQMLYVYNHTDPMTNKTEDKVMVRNTKRILTTLEKSQPKRNAISWIKLEYIFTNISKEDFGEYSLMAGNKHGYDIYPFQILHISYLVTTVAPLLKASGSKTDREESVEKTVVFIVITSLLAGLIFVAFIIFFICRVRSKDKFKNNNISYMKPLQTVILNLGDNYTSGVTMLTSVSTSSYGSRHFRRSSLNGNINHDKQKLNLKMTPDPAWEIPLERIQTECLLGEGAFGRVVRATVTDLPNQPGVHTVAVKMLKEDCCDQDMKDLISEIEVMKSIGKHKNILNLLAVSSQQGELYMIVEYCCHGNLRCFLKEHRPVMQANSVLTKKLSLYDLTSFCLQVAKGMNYLASKKCIHRDIAARNVLVGEGYIMKIADFGLARDVHEQDYYRKCTDGRLPVKWMAIEALFDRVYTTQSDIWSFGILAWEIVTFGGSPYPGIALEKLFDLLKQGYRMERPLNCTDDMYSLMLNCWKEIPSKRPTFSQLIQDLERMLVETSSAEYLDLQLPVQSQSTKTESFSTPPSTYSASIFKSELHEKDKIAHDDVSFTHDDSLDLSEIDVLLSYQAVS